MRKFVGFLLLSFMTFSCEVKREKVKSFSDIEEMFQLKNYQNQSKQVINDSIVHYIAKRQDFILTGNFNTRINSKTGTWHLKNVKDFQEVQIDYLAFGKNDVFKNQIIFRAANKKIDSAKSKFFIIKEKNKKEVILKFFSPEGKDELSKKAKVMYTILRDSKELKNDSIVYQNIEEGKYLAHIKYDFKKGDKIRGYFSEYVMLKSSKKDTIVVGNNTIYFREKIE